MGSRFPDHYNSPGNIWGKPPGVNDPEYKVLNTTGDVDAIHTEDIVKVSVVPGVYNTVKVTWPEVAGAISYSVYSGFSLFIEHATLRVTQAGTEYTFKFYPSVTTDLLTQVWVKANYASDPSTFLQASPASVEHFKEHFARENKPLEGSYADLVADNDYMRFISAEIRRRAITMIQNDGEEFDIYVRRWSGEACTCSSTEANLLLGPDAIQGDITDPAKGIGAEPDLSLDPQNDALSRCNICLGTGIKGAYYYGITTLMRYGNIPPRNIIFKNFAIDLPHNFNTWTVWEPKIHAHDIIRRKKTGEVFEVEDAARGAWRGVAFHQEAKMNLLPPGDPRYKVVDSFIQAAESA